ncbi:hypothetical protein KSF_074840 [Reticulibacter mediterranei]|uniref:Toxin n=1 Tax=Reticulibacter mediterranei TaxID=2778369 RepID=A0A8J3IMS0_9CHLR|nr:SpvB/TcaC N-terminal domain-containing protein [Reticulibacter mediterranei]GHO97436.1 hypothetical protein KSF_074840 [Reticulibacter mediterranei]
MPLGQDEQAVGKQSVPDTSGSRASSEASRKPLPTVSLPKGGGAIRGIGEKFAANPVTGTGSMSVPIATSPGRSGFGPQLSLSYDSGAGNGPFGFGWNLTLPAITRKTDKGLPQYRDAKESDVYILSGAEDLVPEFKKDDTGKWIIQDSKYVIFDDPRTVGSVTYRVRRYRPRIEGLFARIERWTNEDSGEVHWRSISRDNITTLYGKTAESRVADPADATKHVFTWLICESYDDKGNAIVYEYAAENDDNVDRTQANEGNRVREANRYLRRIKYGNRMPNRDTATWQATDPALLAKATWMFEVVFDYNEGYYTEAVPDDQERIFARAQIKPPVESLWLVRQDPFSSYRSGFEVRTYRLCRRVLMFHHFPQELGTADYLVRSTEFSYVESPIASFISSVTQSGYIRQPTQTQPNRYLKKSMPLLEFEYSQVPDASKMALQPIREVDGESLENLPIGLDGISYQWMDLDGEGTSGILTEQADGWYYKRNESAKNQVARFGPMERVASLPAVRLAGGAQFLDLAGDGQVDLVQMEGPLRGFYERTVDAGWGPFQPFVFWPNLNTRDPDLKFVDLTSDGHTDILITEGEHLVWYPSLAEDGFGPAVRASLPPDEEKGPRLVFADGEQSVYLADLSGDGLSDLVRIRNGEVCYWPNLGYGHFGAKVTMDHAPWFDAPDQFDQRRIRLADIDGSGTTDILYLRRDGVHIYFNQSGNRWSDPVVLSQFPPIDTISSVQALDLLGNGTACLVWSSPLPGAARRPMHYLALMEEKPHLLVGVKNNLGAETKVYYAPSTRFYLDDKQKGKSWITRLPFPVHVVERVEIYDRISGNHFVTQYKYHHGYFDGVEREFRGFGMVEQLDTEAFAALTEGDTWPEATNLDAASHVPPVRTCTWFHTGVYLDREQISRQFEGEYYHEPGLSDQEFLPDTMLPTGLTLEEEREACRALKGMMLRQEVYALDGTGKAEHPYTVTEQNFAIERLQPKGDNRHAIFFTHAREAITYHYERNSTDPRISHALTLEVDPYGNMLKSLVVGYGRRPGKSPLQGKDKEKQEQVLITYTENDVTNAIDAPVDDPKYDPDNYRTPLPSETRSYEVTGFELVGDRTRFSFDDFAKASFQPLITLHQINYEEPTNYSKKQKRLIERVRTLYRPDDLGVSQNDPLTLLPLGIVQPLALPGESYKLAFTPGLLAKIYQRPLDVVQPPGSPPPENLLPNPSDVLSGQGADGGGYVDLNGDGRWWIPSGRTFFSPNPNNTAVQELAHACQHFFLPHRYRDPFHTNAISTYDGHNLLMVETHDALGNIVTVNTEDDDGNIAIRNDYRVLQPYWVTDPNGNRTQVTFDALGMVVATAVMGKPRENKGDNLINFKADLTQTQMNMFHDTLDPHTLAATLLQGASTRIIYDLHRFSLSQQAHPKDSTQWEPPYAATLARETHASDPLPSQGLKIQISFSYSDGFGREIQKKIQAEPGKVEVEDAVGNVTFVDTTPNVRWVGSGWTIFNNKGKPVRQYEPFFSTHHQFQFGKKVGVSPILFYDPVERVVATLHPNHTYEKVVFDPWRQVTYDVNDTVAPQDNDTGDPRTDPDIKGYVAAYFKTQPATWQTWYTQRQAGAPGTPEQSAATKSAVHADTPTVAYFDTLGRTFLTVAHNKFRYRDTPSTDPPVEESYRTRVIPDIEGNQREVIDAKDCVVMRYDYDMLSNRIHQASMEAGERWMLNDVMGKPIRAWDGRGHTFRTEYDPLRRPLRISVTSTNSANPNQEILTERMVYGEQHPKAELRNLRGQLYLHLDQAGVVLNERYDFKGNLLRASRRFTSGTQYKQTVDWSAVDANHGALPLNATAKLDLGILEAALALLLEVDTFTSHTSYDALNRPTQLIAPRSDQPGAKRNVIQPAFNEANLLERVDVWLDHPAEPAGLLDAATVPPSPVGVNNIDYDAKGQRLRIEYKNGATTRYSYDPETFRLIHLYTRRGATFTGDCENPLPPPPTIAAPDIPPLNTPCGLQNLHYTYDPAGNITHIRDDAQQTIYFRNRRVEPSTEYSYDAIYRLIEAMGREHLGQNGGVPLPPSSTSYNDKPRVGLLHPGDGNVMGRYFEQYLYDEVGNFREMYHRSTDPSDPGWRRVYIYDETSLLEVGKKSNRLTRTTLNPNGAQPQNEDYTHDIHGNMLTMPQLQVMQWDFKDQLQMTQRQAVNAGDTDGVQHQGESTWYVYDTAGHRVRKVTELATGAVKDEHIYLGGFEIYRKHSGVNAGLVRESLHIMDGKQRIALVETRNDINDGTSKQFIRYQFGNHLGSASLELDEQAQVVSYEEYTPYGSASYQAVRCQTETPKRYRYTGKERDEESGLYYHGARYYAPWLGRWVSCDPIGLVDGVSAYFYANCNPTIAIDPNGLASVQADLNKVQPKIPQPAPSNTIKDATGPQLSTAKPITQDVAVGPQEPVFAQGETVLEPRLPKQSSATNLAIGIIAWKVVDQTLELLETLSRQELPGATEVGSPWILPGGQSRGPGSFPGIHPADENFEAPSDVNKDKVSAPGQDTGGTSMEVGRPNFARRSEHADWGYYWNPFTNDIEFTNERMATDHIYPEVLIRKLPDFDLLTPEQQSQVLNHPDNFQPLPRSLNSSKRDRTAEEWQNAFGQSFHPDYIRDAIKYEQAIKKQLTQMIDTFRQQNVSQKEIDKSLMRGGNARWR